MQKFSTWMVLSLDIVFWIVRIIATYTSAMAIDFMITPINLNTEIMLLFVALLCFVLIAKRKLLGVILYLVSYLGYFGVDLWNNLVLTNGQISAANYMNVFFSFIGIALPIFTMLDWLLDKNKQLHPTDKKTDWYYTNQKYDIKNKYYCLSENEYLEAAEIGFHLIGSITTPY